MRVTVDQARKQRFPATVINVGVRRGPQNRVGWTDGGNRVAVDGERDIVLNRVNADNGRVREDDSSTCRRLGVETCWFKEECGRAGTSAGKKLATADRNGWLNTQR